MAHLVNATGKIPLDRVTPLGPMHIRFAGMTAKQAKWHAPGKDPLTLDCRSESGDTIVVVPRLEAYGLVVLAE